MRLARGGVLLTVWALTAGWPRGRLDGRLRRDGWQRIWRGAWAAPGKEVDWRMRAAAAQLLRPQLVCSHRTAAAVHRIELLGGRAGTEGAPEPLEFTARRGRGSKAHEPIRVHTTARLADADCATRRGLRVTSAVRTVGDLIRAAASREAAVVVADSALSPRFVAGLHRPPLVDAAGLAAELAAPRRPGGPSARRWLPLAVAGSGSPAETVARLRMRDAGLHPETQPTLHTAAGRPLHPDFLFRAAGLVVEIEGFAFHGTRAAHERDVRRFNELQSCPDVRRVLRFTAGEVFGHPDRMTATIRAALASLTATGRPGPGYRPGPG
ncbi:hypothetical protein AB0A60_26105 [Streptomyces sp. NPDC046275]|uniref:endonuclease domain-containing protein n=1 Tax=Streptomyces sp. NPDC046275 TaxID=3157201 RepID=UPI0033F2EB9A